jgi:hypothetical protein
LVEISGLKLIKAGVKESDTIEHIATEKRRLLAVHHPDKFRGQPDDVIEKNAAIFIEYVTAWEVILTYTRETTRFGEPVASLNDPVAIFPVPPST